MRCPGVLGASHLHPRLMAFAPPGRDKRTLTDTSTPHLLRHRRPADGARISYSPNLPNVPGVPGYLRQHSRHHSPSDGSAPTRHLPCPCTISRPGGAKDDSRGWSEAWRAGTPGRLTVSVVHRAAPWRGARGAAVGVRALFGNVPGLRLRAGSPHSLGRCKGADEDVKWEFREDTELSTQDPAVAGQAHVRSMADTAEERPRRSARLRADVGFSRPSRAHPV